MRETICQELLFNPSDLYVLLSSSDAIGKESIRRFLQIDVEDGPIESLIRHYVGNNKEMSRTDFLKIFLPRQNRLLSKLVQERAKHGYLSNSLINYVRKILMKEIELHYEIEKLRKNIDVQLVEGMITPMGVQLNLIEDVLKGSTKPNIINA